MRYPANLKRCDNVAVRSQRLTTSTRCTDAGAITSKLQSCSNVASMLDISSCPNISWMLYIDNVVATLKLRRQIYNLFSTLTLWRQIYMATLLQLQIVVSTPNRPQLLQWQRYYNVENATSNSQSPLNVDITTLHQHCVSFA